MGQPITVQLTHPTAYFVQHTRVEIDFGLRVVKNQIPVHDVYKQHVLTFYSNIFVTLD
jgi:hypothetical protein